MFPNLLFPPPPAASLLLGTLPCLVLSEHNSRSLAGTYLFKMLSSAAFLGGPLLLTTTAWSPYSQLISAAGLLSLIGDFCLLPSRKQFYPSSAQKKSSAPTSSTQPKQISTSFQLGVVAFAAAHIAYIVAFLRDSQFTSWPVFAGTFALTMLLAKGLGVTYPPAHYSPWGNLLDLSISPDMKPLVSIYAVIISAMFAAAASSTALTTSSEAWPYQRLFGAAMFVVSDIFVAKDAFGRTSDPKSRGWFRILVGYGLYFWGQMVLAGTVEA